MISIFSKNLRKLRKKNKLTQKELANYLNISQSTIAMYESGKREPDSNTLIKISKFFSVPIDDLLKDKTDSKLLPEDEIDIAKELERTIEHLKTNKGIKFDGEPLDEITLEYLKLSLEKSIRLAKEIIKDKFDEKDHE